MPNDLVIQKIQHLGKKSKFYLYLYINLACLSVCLFGCLSVCLYPINVKTAEPRDRAQIFCGTCRDPSEGLWMIKILRVDVVIKVSCLVGNPGLESFSFKKQSLMDILTKSFDVSGPQEHLGCVSNPKNEGLMIIFIYYTKNSNKKNGLTYRQLHGYLKGWDFSGDCTELLLSVVL